MNNTEEVEKGPDDGLRLENDELAPPHKQNKHNAGDLAQMQSLPLEAKIQMTKRRIREWYEAWDGDVYVSFSGGKDSTVLKHIVDSIYKDVPAVFVNTGLEYPEIQRFVKDVKAGKWSCFSHNVEIIRPEMRFDEVIKKYGYPVISKEVSQKIYEGRRATRNGNPNNYATRQFNGEYVSKSGKKNSYPVQRYKFLYESDIPISNMCCNIIKKRPSKKYEHQTGKRPFIATLASESYLRKSEWLKNGCNAFDNDRPVSKPLSFWTENDILEYILKYDVPYCSVYGEIVRDVAGNLRTTKCDRTGCMYCMYGVHLEKPPNRFQRMKETHPKQYDFCMNKLGIKEVLEYINVPYE